MINTAGVADDERYAPPGAEVNTCHGAKFSFRCPVDFDQPCLSMLRISSVGQPLELLAFSHAVDASDVTTAIIFSMCGL